MLHRLNDYKRVWSRDPTRLQVPPCASALYSKNCHAVIINIYKKLPNTIRELQLRQFKNILTKQLTQFSIITIVT